MTRKCPSGLEVIMVFDADKLVTMQPVTTTLKILDPQGAPISNALVYCSFYIPNFATGANSPKIKATDQNGLYEGLVFFTHEGRWNVDLTINLPNGGYEEVTFNIDQVLPNPTISAL
ncbi:MAG: FixH family protein [Desulfuromonadales bacterium]|nr:FixH family protein [Desulfuromonadales bacterium]